MEKKEKLEKRKKRVLLIRWYNVNGWPQRQGGNAQKAAHLNGDN